MSDIFFQEMEIPYPTYQLNVGGKSHGEMTGEMVIELEKLMLKERPDIVLIYGDTNSTMAAAISSSKLHIPIAHVEAGLRSYNKNMPEEINRIIADHVSDIFFCTSEIAAKNLKKENIKHNINIVGDTMYDATLYYKKNISEDLFKKVPKEFFLVTCHRQENTDVFTALTSIFSALDTLSETLPVVIPLHPRTKKFIEQYKIDTSNLIIIEPVGYFDMLCLLKNCKIVLTDSGGLQKEAYYFKKPTVIMRDETEWLELVNNKIAILTGSRKEKILKAVNDLSNAVTYPENIYGDGKAADKIVDLLYKNFNK
jgi:UDP-GlcNAc3NAcA epimerase